MAEGVTTIKVQRRLRDRLSRLATEQHTSMGVVIERAVERLEREAFMARVHADLARLRDEHPDEWAADRDESRGWEEATVGDGLGDDPWPG